MFSRNDPPQKPATGKTVTREPQLFRRGFISHPGIVNLDRRYPSVLELLLTSQQPANLVLSVARVLEVRPDLLQLRELLLTQGLATQPELPV